MYTDTITEISTRDYFWPEGFLQWALSLDGAHANDNGFDLATWLGVRHG